MLHLLLTICWPDISTHSRRWLNDFEFLHQDYLLSCLRLMYQCGNGGKLTMTMEELSHIIDRESRPEAKFEVVVVPVSNLLIPPISPMSHRPSGSALRVHQAPRSEAAIAAFVAHDKNHRINSGLRVTYFTRRSSIGCGRIAAGKEPPVLFREIVCCAIEYDATLLADAVFFMEEVENIGRAFIHMHGIMYRSARAL